MPSHRLPGAAGRGRVPLDPLTPRLPESRLARSQARRLRLAATILVLIAFAVAAAGLGYAAYLSRAISFNNPAEEQQIRTQLANVSGQPYNVLIAGVDTTSQGEHYPTATMILAHVDPQQRRTWLLWISPALLSMIPGHGEEAIANAHLYGSAAGTIQAVRKLSGLPVNQYVEVDYRAIQRAVDAVGGVWVDVPASIEDTQADSSPNHGAGTLQPGTQLLDGYHALTFMRAQPLPGAPNSGQDYARIEDQHLLIDALAKEIAKRALLPGEVGALSAAGQFVKTTMSLEALAGTANDLRNAGSANIYDATVIGTSKPPYIVVDPATLTKLVGDIRAGTPFNVPAAELESAAASSITVTSTKTPSQVSVTVQNGGGISGAAKQAATVLQTQGFHIASTGNASRNVYPQTFVIYKSDKSLARLVAQYLPTGTKIVQSFGFYTFKTDILVIVGRDWDIGKVPAVPITTP